MKFDGKDILILDGYFERFKDKDLQQKADKVINDILKERIYIKSPQEAPQGADVKRGSRGGLYYEEQGQVSSTPTEQEKKPNGDKQIIENVDKILDQIVTSSKDINRWGLCGGASKFLAEKIDGKATAGERYDTKTGEWIPHWWVEKDNQIIDITADQFKDSPQKILITTIDDQRYEIDEERTEMGSPFKNENELIGNVYKKIKDLYEGQTPRKKPRRFKATSHNRYRLSYVGEDEAMKRLGGTCCLNANDSLNWNSPVDLIDEQKRIAYEIKTFSTDAKDIKVKTNPEIKMRKEEWAKANNYILKTLVVLYDKRNNSTEGYIKDGYGGYRIPQMERLW